MISASLADVRGRLWAILGAGLFLLGISLLGVSVTNADPLPPSISSAPTDTKQPNARQLLRQMLKAENTLALSGEQTTTLSRNGKTLTTRQRVQRNGSRALRVDYLAPPRFAGEQIVDNGRLYRHYVPSTDTLEVGPSRLERLRGRVPQVMERVRRGALLVESVGTETVAGHPCAIVQVKPQGAAPWRRFWIDPATGAQLRIEQYDRSGRRVSVSSYSSVVYNPMLDAQAFRAPHTPPDVHVVALDPAPPLPTVAQAQARVAFAVREPGYLPPGFRFQSASVAGYRGRSLVTLRYVNGLSVLSLFETPAAHPGKSDAAAKPSHPRRNVVQAFQNGLRLILVGSLAPGEMERVLASLH